MWVALVVVGIMGVFSQPVQDEGALVGVESGLIRGAASPVATGVRVFRGIPYARPPLGSLRWRAPQPVEPWSAVREAMEFGPSCLQPSQRIVPAVQGRQSEDCLYLNVWTAGRAGEKRPVMVWIHGGGFAIGSGSQPSYEGSRLAAGGAVLVTFNYRLGPFGFLAHPALSAESSGHTSGNYGLLDQIAALRWVKKNIAAFGGDPGRVTLFGESAGAVSIACLLASPLADGLFQGAILESGVGEGVRTPLRGPSARGPSAEGMGVEIARQLGLQHPGSQDAATAEQLRARPASEVLLASDPRVGLFGQGRKFWPVIDGRVLPRSPAQACAAGECADVPVVLGTNHDEGTLFLRQLGVRRPFGYRLLMRKIFGQAAHRVLELFPAPRADEVRPALARLITASAFVAPTRRTARLLSRKGRSRVWLYHFTRVSPGAGRLGVGATHGIEIPYVFGTLPPGNWADATDARLSQSMRAAWLRFAASGDPRGPRLEQWPPYTRENDAYLEFGDRVRVGRGLWREASDLFDDIRRLGSAGQSRAK